jgi:hypothetical protein
MFLPLLSASILGLVKLAYADGIVVHDENFIPDAILHVSSGEIKQSCVASKETLLVNGTSPGPELRFTEGKTIWIRVYNDLAHENLTMVSFIFSFCPHSFFTILHYSIPNPFLFQIGESREFRDNLKSDVN